MTTAARSCQACGTELPARATGRPATYCSTSCRQGAHRAKQRARASAERAAAAREAMARDLEEALGMLHKAAGLLAEPRRAAEAEVARTVAEGGKGWHAGVPSGWEGDVAELAEIAARRARTVVEQLREHARAAVEHRQALPVAGIRRAPAARRRDDETPGGPSSTGAAPSVASTAAEDLATKPAPVDGRGGELADVDAADVADVDLVDRDMLFDAVADVVAELDPQRSDLPHEVEAALAAPAGQLATVFADQFGDGPIEGMLAAVRRLLRAAGPVLDQPGIPDSLIGVLAELEAAAPPRIPGQQP
jgi:hypothetical protein